MITFASGCAQWNPGTGLDRLKRWTEPSNDRDWRPEFAKTSTITRQNQVLSIRNIRNCNYLSSDDFVVDYYDRQFTVDQIQTVDFIVVPFQNAPRLAHTMMSFGLDDSSYIAVSVEVRKEVGESYSAIKGIGRQYELMYVVSDERDVIRLRTRHRDADVYVYPTIANPIQAQELFLNIAERVNKLAVDPEFYNTITNNCTTNLAGHVNEVSPNKIKYGWKVLLPGLSAKYAYDLGLLDTRIPFEDLKTLSHVNDLAEEHFDDPQFSQLIRSNHSRLERYLARQALREPTLNARGQLFLNTISKKR
ncbi:MAG: DUF4105 domain-containing protein [Planctomycetota bacterium]